LMCVLFIFVASVLLSTSFDGKQENTDSGRR
jgi:hypothetical protein